MMRAVNVRTCGECGDEVAILAEGEGFRVCSLTGFAPGDFEFERTKHKAHVCGPEEVVMLDD